MTVCVLLVLEPFAWKRDFCAGRLIKRCRLKKKALATTRARVMVFIPRMVRNMLAEVSCIVRT